MNAKIKRFERNTIGSDLIVGDVHGHFSILQAALDAVGFNPSCDRLFSVGDLVDRGPESGLVIEWLDKPWFFPVTGNHEDMAIRWGGGQHIDGEWVRNMDASNYLANGGAWNISNPEYLQRQIADALAALPLAIELETEEGLVGIVHAECPFDDWDIFRSTMNDATQSKSRLDRVEATAQWARSRIEYSDRTWVRGIYAVVVGHTPVPERTVLGNVHYIDTGGGLIGRAGIPWVPHLTFLNASTLEVVKP